MLANTQGGACLKQQRDFGGPISCQVSPPALPVCHCTSLPPSGGVWEDGRPHFETGPAESSLRLLFGTRALLWDVMWPPAVLIPQFSLSHDVIKSATRDDETRKALNTMRTYEKEKPKPCTPGKPRSPGEYDTT